MKFRIFFILVITLLSSSCSMKSNMIINKNNIYKYSGKFSFKIIDLENYNEMLASGCFSFIDNKYKNNYILEINSIIGSTILKLEEIDGYININVTEKIKSYLNKFCIDLDVFINTYVHMKDISTILEGNIPTNMNYKLLNHDLLDDKNNQLSDKIFYIKFKKINSKYPNIITIDGKKNNKKLILYIFINK
ncbi:hypothetical protein CKSOR_00096 [Candidatus Kinetoplastibacterium sorsogonicusi]|uniref:Outer-membrane lipoprotein LolB n=1 Tax=Candidatus Kinetoplastidibacterium kentomonadis TaxID=1576550 RepID=A0A3Q8ETX7_9PROT|nr:hypothetical protein [Candidatus Kinetoplastibacterium sorsogonicusi]AWD32238.1 hypothetical protein CKSOR_00096 [Candidatus Kinetoplastibacterium sorsogonicusi]